MTTRSALVAACAAMLLVAATGEAAVASPTVVETAHYTNHFRISAQGDVLVGSRARRTTADLRLARGTERPVRIAGIAPVPSWAMPHVGTDVSGNQVVVYPRCAKQALSSCDLYAFDLSAEREQRLAGASAPGVAETEGVLDRGALAFSVWTSKRDPVEVQDQNEPTALFYRTASGSVTSLGAGGQQLALTRGWIAQVRGTEGRPDGADAPECGSSAVELVRTTGGRRFAVRSMKCGAIKTFQSPTFIGDSVIFGATGTDRHPNGLLYRYDRLSGRTFTTRGPSQFDQFVATSETDGYAVWQQDQLRGGSDVIRVTGLAFDREVTTPRSARRNR